MAQAVRSRRWLAALVAAALSACETLDRDTLRCEEAVALVLACCPEVTQSPVACVYVRSPTAPLAWTFPKVDCLVGRSCQAIRDRGACAWAADGGTGEVCP